MYISVAIASYNGGRFIEKQLDSILKQTRPVDEVIICDDGSTDNTVEICRNFIEKNSLTNWEISVNPKNVGYCFNFYGAIAKTKGDIIFLADQDDEWYPDKVEKMLACMEKYKDITVLASRYDVIDENSDIIENSGVTYLGERFDGSVDFLTADSFIGCSYIRGFNMCFRKSIKEYLKPLDLKSLLSHDWYICMLGTVKGKTAVLNSLLGGYRFHHDNVSLSDMDRKKLIGNRKKRVDGLRESIAAHNYIAELTNDAVLKEKIVKFAAFETKRLRFLEKKNPFLWLALALDMGSYARYYKGGGLRVWLGDFAYAYNINMNFRV